jgi:enoyl-CoA hydratase
MLMFSDAMVKLEIRERIAYVRFDRADNANGLAVAACRRLADIAHQLGQEHDLAAVILSGQAGLFSKGADLRDPELIAVRDKPWPERRQIMQAGGRMCRAWAQIECLTIAAVTGWCVGGGVALAASCDLRVADPGARFYVPEIERGMNLSWGAVPRLTHLVGPARAKRLVMLAQVLSAQEALQWGLIDEVSAAGEAHTAAQALASRAVEMPAMQMRMIKRSIDASAFALDESISHADFDQFELAASSEEFANRIAPFSGRAQG